MLILIVSYTKGLGNAPIVLLSCNHYVHYSYIKKRLEGRWLENNIQALFIMRIIHKKLKIK